MDPDACLKELMRALVVQDREAVIEHMTNLRDWIAKGGFLPNVAYVNNTDVLSAIEMGKEDIASLRWLKLRV